MKSYTHKLSSYHFTFCGVGFNDLPDEDFVTTNHSKVDCPGCKAAFKSSLSGAIKGSSFKYVALDEVGEFKQAEPHSGSLTAEQNKILDSLTGFKWDSVKGYAKGGMVGPKDPLFASEGPLKVYDGFHADDDHTICHECQKVIPAGPYYCSDCEQSPGPKKYSSKEGLPF